MGRIERMRKDSRKVKAILARIDYGNTHWSNITLNKMYCYEDLKSREREIYLHAGPELTDKEIHEAIEAQGDLEYYTHQVGFLKEKETAKERAERFRAGL